MRGLHPLTHILFCILFSSLAFLTGSLPFLSVLLLLSVCYAALRIKRGLVGVLRSLYRSFSLILSLGIIQIVLNHSGQLLWSWGVLRVSSGGVYWAVLVGLRLLVIIMCAKAMAVLSFSQFQTAIATLHLPEEIGFMLAYGTHLVPEFSARIKGFLRSLRLRGIDPKQISIRQRIKLYRMLSLSVLAEVLSQSTDAAIALELRGFRSSGKRSHLHIVRWGAPDVFALAGVLLLIMILMKLLG